VFRGVNCITVSHQNHVPYLFLLFPFLLCHACYTSLQSDIPWCDHPNIFSMEYKQCNSLCHFLYPVVTFSLLVLNSFPANNFDWLVHSTANISLLRTTVYLSKCGFHFFSQSISSAHVVTWCSFLNSSLSDFLNVEHPRWCTYQAYILLLGQSHCTVHIFTWQLVSAQ
jgi:hypothetical protein